MGEHGRGDAPLSALNTLTFKKLLPVFVGLFCRVSVDHLVEAGKHVATSDVLERAASLDQKATSWDFDRTLFPVASPHVQTRVARLAVNCHEGNVVVETGENSPDIVFLEVGSSRGQKVRSSLHSPREGIPVNSHAKSSHLTNCLDGFVQFIAPLIHANFPVGELGWHHLREVISRAFRSLSDFPHEAPFGVENGSQRRHGHVFLSELQLSKFFLMIASHLDEFRRRADLIVVLGLDVGDSFAGVEFVARLRKVLLHQVNVFVVVLHVYARVLNQQNAEFVETLGNFRALELSFGADVFTRIEEGFKVDDWHVGEVISDDVVLTCHHLGFLTARGGIFSSRSTCVDIFGRAV